MKKIRIRNWQNWTTKHCMNIRNLLYVLIFSLLITFIFIFSLKGKTDRWWFLWHKETNNIKNNKVYLSIIDYINNNTPCKIEWIKNLTLNEILINKKNWKNLLVQCKALKNITLSPIKKQNLIKAIVKWFRITIWWNQIERAYNLVGLKKEWYFSWDKIYWSWDKISWTEDGKMLFYYDIFNKEFNLSKLTLYIDGKKYKLKSPKYTK